MSKFRSIVFIAAFTLICCSAGIGLVLGKLAPDVVITENYLSGGSPASLSMKEIITQPQRLLKDREFADKSRDSIEVGFSKLVPFRDTLMVASAKLHRQGIRTANLLTGFEIYPSYYGSRYVELPKDGAVSYIPGEGSDVFWHNLHCFAEGLAKKARQHSDTTFVMYLVPGKSTPGASPLYEYMDGLITPQQVMAALDEDLQGVDNLVLLTDTYETVEDYYRNFFKTDHHWNILGALQARNTIGMALGWEPLAAATKPVDGYEDYRFIGTNARGGLDVQGEKVFDLDYDFGQLDVEYADGTVADGNDHAYFTDYTGLDKPYVFHSRYYNTPSQVGTFTNNDPHATGKALLISDSYGGAISRPLALQFEKLCRSNDLFNESKGRRFEKTFGKDDYSTVFFVAHAADFTTAVVNSRHYFD